MLFRFIQDNFRVIPCTIIFFHVSRLRSSRKAEFISLVFFFSILSSSIFSFFLTPYSQSAKIFLLLLLLFPSTVEHCLHTFLHSRFSAIFLFFLLFRLARAYEYLLRHLTSYFLDLNVLNKWLIQHIQYVKILCFFFRN
jgi:hypothetical protein